MFKSKAALDITELFTFTMANLMYMYEFPLQSKYSKIDTTYNLFHFVRPKFSLINPFTFNYSFILVPHCICNSYNHSNISIYTMFIYRTDQNIW